MNGGGRKMGLRRTHLAWIVAIGLTLFPLAANAGNGIVDEMKLGVLDHDVPIGGDHKECCVDVNGEILFTSPIILN